MFKRSSSKRKENEAKHLVENFRKAGSACVEYICDVSKVIQKKQVFPDIRPGYLRALLPREPPNDPEEFKDVLNDFDKYIIPGTLHWLHPNFHAYYPTGNAFPNILGDMLSTAFMGVGFSWTAQPSLTELENIMMDWLARALDLPSFFIFEDSKGIGGGCIQNSASDSLYLTLTASRYVHLKKLGAYAEPTQDNPMPTSIHPGQLLSKLVCYTSYESHCNVQKAAAIALCTIRLLMPEANGMVNGTILEEAIKRDLSENLVPFYCCCTIGTIGGCAFDDLRTMGPICKKYGLWMHVDAAYAGNAFICPEFRKFKVGIEYADSFVVNPYKLMLGGLDLTCLYLKNVQNFKMSFVIDATYLLDEFSSDQSNETRMNIIDYRHYGIALSRRARSMKLWFLFRSYGLNGLRAHIRNTVDCAKYLEKLIHEDCRFEVCNEVFLGLVCFRQVPNRKKNRQYEDSQNISFTDKQNLNLLYRINKSRKLHLSPHILNGQYVLRFSVNYEHTNHEIIASAWQFIQSQVVTTLDTDISEQISKISMGLAHVHPISQEKFEEYEKTNDSIPLSFGPILFPVDEQVKDMLHLPPITVKSSEHIQILMDNTVEDSSSVENLTIPSMKSNSDFDEPLTSSSTVAEK